MTPFNSGDIVQLKSGGPKMTVTENVADGIIRCQWFAGCILQQSPFKVESVDHAVDNGDDDE